MKKLLYIFIVYLGFHISGCAYFNTFFVTKKYFYRGLKQIEKEEKSASRKMKGEGNQTAQEKAEERKRRVVGIGSFNQCIEKGSKLLEVYPRSKWVDDCLYIIGRAMYYKGDYNDAITKFEELTNLYSDSKFVPEARYWWGMTYIEMERYDKAEEQLREVIDLNAEKKVLNDANLGLAEILYLQERYEEAVESYQNLADNLDKNELKAEAQLMVGECYFELEDYESAAVNFRKALSFSKTQTQKYYSEFNYALSRKNFGDYNEAASVFKKLLEDGKNVSHFPELRIQIADCLKIEEKFEEAIDIYEDIANIYQKTNFSLEAYYYMGLIYFKEYVDFKKAQESFKKGLEGTPMSEMKDLVNRKLIELDNMDKIRENIMKEDSLKQVAAVELKAEMDTARVDDKKIQKKEMERLETMAKNRFLLGEFYLDEVEVPDSAIVYFNKILNDFQETTFAPKTLLLLYDINNTHYNKTEEAKKYLERLIDDYPQSDYSNSAREKLKVPTIVLVKDSLRTELYSAEKLYFEEKEFDKAIEKYRNICTDFPEFEDAAKCRYLIGWHYEVEELNSELAFEEYKILAKDYPESEYTKLITKQVSDYEKIIIAAEKEREKKIKEEQALIEKEEAEKKAGLEAGQEDENSETGEKDIIENKNEPVKKEESEEAEKSEENVITEKEDVKPGEQENKETEIKAKEEEKPLPVTIAKQKTDSTGSKTGGKDSTPRELLQKEIMKKREMIKKKQDK